MTTRNLIRWCFLFPVALLLAACNSEPSAQDMRNAYLNHPDAKKGFEMMEFAPEDFRVEKISCQKATGAPGYQCDLRTNSPLTPETMHSGSARFVKSDTGWVVIPENQ